MSSALRPRPARAVDARGTVCGRDGGARRTRQRCYGRSHVLPRSRPRWRSPRVPPAAAPSGRSAAPVVRSCAHTARGGAWRSRAGDAQSSPRRSKPPRALRPIPPRPCCSGAPRCRRPASRSNPRRSGRSLHPSRARSTLRQAMGTKCVCHQRLPAGSWLASDASAGLGDRPPRSRPSEPPCAFVSVSVTGLFRERGEPMNAATHWKCEDVLRRPVAVEGRSKRDAGHSETHSRVKRPVSEGRMALPTPFETKRKKAPIGALGRIQYLNVAEREGFEPSRRV